MDENKVTKIEIEPHENPWEVAQKIINAEYESKTILGTSVIGSFFDTEELLRIGTHIVNYCKTEMMNDQNT